MTAAIEPEPERHDDPRVAGMGGRAETARRASDVDRAVAAALAATGLHASFTSVVREWTLDTRDQWRVCCGSGCDPCVDTVARAVDIARARLRA